MVLQIILADILLIARFFPHPCGARKKTTQLVKYPRVLSVKPSNTVYIYNASSQDIMLLKLWYCSRMICICKRRVLLQKSGEHWLSLFYPGSIKLIVEKDQARNCLQLRGLAYLNLIKSVKWSPSNYSTLCLMLFKLDRFWKIWNESRRATKPGHDFNTCVRKKWKGYLWFPDLVIPINNEPSLRKVWWWKL